MELSSRVSKEWDENYQVQEVRFSPKTGFFSPPDRLVVVGQLDGQDKSSIVEVPYNLVEIKYQDGIKPRLTLHKRIREGQMMDAYMSGPYRKEELVKGSFELPTGYKVLGLEELAQLKTSE